MSKSEEGEWTNRDVNIPLVSIYLQRMWRMPDEQSVGGNIGMQKCKEWVGTILFKYSATKHVIR